ncbi:MAG: hypothetical protein ACOCVM_04950, partial [Desulfovibrionaceae bacterium]
GKGPRSFRTGGLVFRERTEVFVSLYHVLNETTRRVAEERGVLLIDLDRIVPKSSDYLFDEIHLNTNGSVYVAEAVAVALEALLEAQATGE